MKPPRPTLSYAEMEAAGHFERPRTQQAIATYLDECLLESQGDALVVAEALAYVAGEDRLRLIARECGLPCDVLRRQLSGKRTLTLKTVVAAMRILGVRMRVDVSAF